MDYFYNCAEHAKVNFDKYKIKHYLVSNIFC